MQFLRHLFTPHHTNNYRSKILHNASLLVIIIVFSILSFSVSLVKHSKPEILGISYSINIQDLLTATNNARVQNNEASLVLSDKLSDAARRKAANMFQNNYWAHFAPDGTTPWSFIKSAGYDYSFAGENLAKGFTSSQDVVNAWMNSPSHRENLLSSKYKDIGFAVVEGKLKGEDTALVVQMFGSQAGTAELPTSKPTQRIASEQQKTVEKSATSQVSGMYYQETPKPLFDSRLTTKSIGIVFLVLIVAVLLLDLIIVEKKKIPRIVGHNLDHVILLILFLVFIILESSRGIL